MGGARLLKTDSTHNQSTKILLDTNFLLLPFQRRIDIFEGIERLIGRQVTFLVLPQILKELAMLEASGAAKERIAAKNSQELIQRHCQVIELLNSAVKELDADSALLHCSQKMNAIVATNDRELRRALAKQGNRVIFLRKLAVLAMTE